MMPMNLNESEEENLNELISKLSNFLVTRRLVILHFKETLNHSLEVFRNSYLKDNVILVDINDLEDNLSNEITYYKEFPIINVKSYQADLKVLKSCIESKAAVFVPAPVLIKYPDEEQYWSTGSGKSYLVNRSGKSYLGNESSGKSYLGNQPRSRTFVEGSTLESDNFSVSSNGTDTFGNMVDPFTSLVQWNQLPVHYASRCGHFNIFKYIVDIDNNYPIHYAAYQGQLDIIRYIISIDNNQINQVNKDNKTPLKHAAVYFNRDTVKYLLSSHTININIIDKKLLDTSRYYVDTRTNVSLLFKQPLKIDKEVEVSEFYRNIQVAEKKIVSTTRSVPVQKNWKKWDLNVRKIIEKIKSIGSTEYLNVTETKEILVYKSYAVYIIYKLTYAESSDGKTSLYKKEFVRTEKYKL